MAFPEGEVSENFRGRGANMEYVPVPVLPAMSELAAKFSREKIMF